MNKDPIHMKQIHVCVVYYNKTRRKQQPRSFFQFVSESQKKIKHRFTCLSI